MDQRIPIERSDNVPWLECEDQAIINSGSVWQPETREILSHASLDFAEQQTLGIFRGELRKEQLEIIHSNRTVLAEERTKMENLDHVGHDRKAIAVRVSGWKRRTTSASTKNNDVRHAPIIGDRRPGCGRIRCQWVDAARRSKRANGGPAATLDGCRRTAALFTRPANGSDAKLHGQGPRAEARAARGAPACEARECAPRDAVRFLTLRGGSAAGPKPGRASFCGELGARFWRFASTATC